MKTKNKEKQTRNLLIEFTENNKYKDLTITNALKTFKKDYAKEGTNGYNLLAYIVRDYIKYPTTANVKYNNKLNSFGKENNLILYIISENLIKQR